MRKFKFFLNFGKEENWLNQMVAEGHLLISARMLYNFSPITPGSTVVRIDYRPSMTRSDFADYVSLFTDSGWRHLDGTRSGGPQYFASLSADADAEIFSDTVSKAQRYRRSISVHALLLVPLLIIVLNPELREAVFASPREWYFTPGLWDMQGADFIRAFLFETVFVVFRVGMPLLLMGFCMYGIVVIIYQYALYRKAKTEQKI